MFQADRFVKQLIRSALISTCGITLMAQVDTGTISGIVTDSSGAIIPGARSSSPRRKPTSPPPFPPTARASIPCPPSSGTLRCRGHQTRLPGAAQNGIELRVQDRLELNFTSRIGDRNQRGHRQAPRPLLESETSSLGQVIQEKTVNDLPLNGRTFIQLAT